MAKQEPISFFEFKGKFNNEDTCREHLFHLRWTNGFECPRCENKTYYPIKNRRFNPDKIFNGLLFGCLVGEKIAYVDLTT